METVHIKLTYKAGKLGAVSVSEARGEDKLTLLCLKWEPRMLLLNSPTLETTKEVPSSVHAMKCADFGSLIILREVKKVRDG